MNKPLNVLLAAGLAGLCGLTACERKENGTPPADNRTGTGAAGHDADNTARNERDRDAATKTPMDQSEASADVKTTAAIRRAIMDDSAMSVNAKNIKIITDKGGVVTLRGPVDTQAEKDAIEAKAKAVAGVTRVDNQLEVTAK